jgi:hypothetical protein
MTYRKPLLLITILSFSLTLVIGAGNTDGKNFTNAPKNVAEASENWGNWFSWFTRSQRTVFVTGTIAFPDGTPLNTGFVAFYSEDGRFAYFAEIDKGGNYTMQDALGRPGIPKGTYLISLGTTNPDIPLVAEKYLSPETSGLQFDVKRKTVFNITVEKPE